MYSLSDNQINQIKKQLTIKPFKFGDDPIEPIKNYKVILKSGIHYLRVPIAYAESFADTHGIQLTYDTMYKECTYPSRPDPLHPKAPKGQDLLFDKTTEIVARFATCLLQSPTGSGKTTTALNTVAELKTTCLVLVPTTALMNQWIEEIQRHLGLSRNAIGTVKGARCVWAKKRIVVAVIHNIVQKKYESSFYDHFGMVVWDEADILGARSFSKSMFLFPAKYKLAMTATPKRRDGADKLVFDYFGEVAYKGKVKALPCECILIDYKGTKTSHAVAMNKDNFPRAIMIKMLREDPKRNNMIVGMIASVINDGRSVLALGESIDHLQELRAMLFEELPYLKESDSALFVGKYSKDGKKVSTTQDYLTNVRNNYHKVVFATYGMMDRGVDITYLDTGIDVIPRSGGEQMVGRIRRPHKTKKKKEFKSIIERRRDCFGQTKATTTTTTTRLATIF